MSRVLFLVFALIANCEVRIQDEPDTEVCFAQNNSCSSLSSASTEHWHEDHWTEDHAEAYDSFQFADPDFLKWKYSVVKSELQLEADDVFADIGCGTGTFAKMFINDVDDKIACIDPNDIIDAQPINSTNRGLSKFKMTASQYLLDHTPTKILIKGTWHHLGPEFLFLNKIQSGTRLLIWTRISSSHLPFPAKCHWHNPIETILSTLEAHGFACNFKEVEYLREFTWVEYYRYLKSRFWSNLETVTDAEIDEFMSSLTADKPVEFLDRPTLILATKINQ